MKTVQGGSWAWPSQVFFVGFENIIPVLQFLKKGVRTKLLSVRHFNFSNTFI